MSGNILTIYEPFTHLSLGAYLSGPFSTPKADVTCL